MGETFLVTGGAGFIGSNLVELLITAGHRVRILDNFSTGHYANLNAFESEIEILEGDVTRAEDCRRAMKGVSRVVHLAAQVSVAQSISSPLETNEVNVSGTCLLLQAAKEQHVESFVFTSTCAVYGDSDLPIDESWPVLPRSPYAVSKLAAEHYVRLFRQLYGLPTVVFRLFNVYGPKQDPSSPYSGVISAFADRLFRGIAPTIYGDGEQTRDFIFVRDVVNAFAWAAMHPELLKQPAYNLATGVKTSVSDLHGRLAKLAGRRIQPIIGSQREGEIRHSRGSSDLYLRARGIDVSDLIPLSEGLEATAHWLFPASLAGVPVRKISNRQQRDPGTQLR